MSPKQVFVREATGLVRELGFVDHFLISQAILGMMGGFLLTVFYAGFYFPGTNLVIVFALGAIPAIVMAYVYGRLSGAMPRSGGDYVWSTRIVGPLYGTIQFVFTIGCLVYFIGFGVWQILAYDSASIFGIGAAERNTGLTQIAISLTQPSVGYPLSMIILLAFIVVAVLGLRVYGWLVRIIMPVYFAIAAIYLVGMLGVDPSTFPGVFEGAMKFVGYNLTYNGIIQTATATGLSPGQFSLTNTLLAAIPWGFLTYTGFNFSSYFAGETKRAKTTVYPAYVLSVLVGAVVLVTLATLTYVKFGAAFMDAVSYVSAANPSTFPVIALPNFFLALTNPTVGLLIGVGLAGGMTVNVTGQIMFLSRMVFAASFDRLVPARLADVNERWHSPHWAVVLVGVISAVYETIWWEWGSVATLLNTSILVPIAFALPLIAACVFPFVKPDLYQRVFGSMKGSTAMAVSAFIGAFCFGFYAFAETTPLISGTFLGASLYLAWEAVAALLVIAVVIYLLGRHRMSSMGIDLKTIFNEIPPE